jgi:prepilin signal peptidase PulO-like enzyme (type II secretory pathway)
MSLSTFVIVCAGIFGALIGSFTNVLILRHGTGRSIVSGRSQCFSCGRILQWYDLIPVLSFVLLRGRCASCTIRIAWQYPIVELVSAFLYAGTAWHLLSQRVPLFEGAILFVFAAIVWTFALAIGVYDMRHTIIPDLWVYTMIIAALAYGTFLPSVLGEMTMGVAFVYSVLASVILATPFALLWLFSRGTWMGLGDAKLTLAIGSFLGLVDGASALIIAIWIGALVGLILMAVHKHSGLFDKSKRFTIKSEIPFGPFLILGMVIVYFFELRAWEWFLSI